MAHPRLRSWCVVLSAVLAVLAAARPSVAAAAPAPKCTADNTVYAYVVALEQVITLNRLGANMPGGMMFALANDVFPKNTTEPQTLANSCRFKQCAAGEVTLGSYKHPRPLVLRVNEGSCLNIQFQNLLTPKGKTKPPTRKAAPHVQGLNWTRGPQDDASFVGANLSSLVSPSDPIKWTEYLLFAEHEGSYLLYSTADDWSPVSGGGDGGALAQGLFGAVNVQPSGYYFALQAQQRGPAKGQKKGETWQSEFYRSQVTEQDLCLASTDHAQLPDSGTCYRDKPDLLPKIDYQATYPEGSPRAHLPILDMVCTRELTPEAIAKGSCRDNELVHGDLTALITGPSDAVYHQPRSFPVLEPDRQPPSLRPNYAYPDRLQPYREFTIIYHESFQVTQAFPGCFTALPSLKAAEDNFGINYGMGGLSSEVLANRLGVGPVASCTDCKFEEFFLSSWALGDPAMNVDNPTTACVDANCKAIACDKPTKALYPDDPSNVYHAYISDHVRFRVLHGGSDLHHLHHQHAQQWLGTPNSPDADYLDSQSIGPGSAFTMEMVYHGTGNVNQVVGDSIFHCHFYPHFASGMWSLWRSHDVFEGGTILGPGGIPANRLIPGSPSRMDYTRALPDGEIAAGTPTPAVVPLPTLPMAPLPAAVQLQGVCSGNPALNCTPAAGCGGQGTCVQQGSRYCVMEGSPAACISELVKTGDPWDKVKELNYRNPGYPFFVPGIGGSRAPHPPLDFAYACANSGKVCDPTKQAEARKTLDPLQLKDTASTAERAADKHPEYQAPIYKGDSALCAPEEGACEPMDGGLPRSVTALGSTADWVSPTVADPSSNYNFSKEIKTAKAIEVPEAGTLIEKVAMATHAQRFHDSRLPDGTEKGICSDNKAPCNPLDPTPRGRWQCGNPQTATCSAAGHVNFVLNGLPPQPGAPFADPCINFNRNGGVPANMLFRSYLAVDLQLDTVFNKEGWHFPQQRMLSLWGDARDFLDRKKPPEPLFMRVNSYDCMTYVLANLVPNVYELDDFQVRTPTDVMGQHIHLVKFDVTSSDGAGNGWNYEDGTFAPNEVTERIHAINSVKGLYAAPDAGGATGPQTKLAAKYIKFFGPGPGAAPTFYGGNVNGAWLGSQATVQRWYDDPLYNNTGRCQPTDPADFERFAADLDIVCTLPNLTAAGFCPHGDVCATDAGQCSEPSDNVCTQSDRVRCAPKASCEPFKDRTIRTVFTHDHFGPSTHQQAGLYAGVVAEPKGSVWRNNETGAVMGGYDSGTSDIVPPREVTQNGVTVQDGGPTSWQAVIETPNLGASFREFLLEIQDSTLTYKPFALGQNPFETSRPGRCAKGEGPCGFCSYTGRCSNDRSKICRIQTLGSAQDTKHCGDDKADCLFDLGTTPNDPNLVACTPTDLGDCFSNKVAVKQVTSESCNFIPGIPAASWLSGGPIDSPVTGAPAKPAGMEAITFSGATNNFSFNYRNEPLFPRINDPHSQKGKPLADWRGDLGYVFSSLRFCDKDPARSCTGDLQCAAGDHCGERPNPRGKVCSGNLAVVCLADKDCTESASACQDAGFCEGNFELCTLGNNSLCAGGTCLAATGAFPYRPLTAGIQPGDPFTPLLRAYTGDDVQIRLLVGAHINPHNFTLHGMNWLTEPSFVDSGWRNSQVMGISEHYNLLVKLDPLLDPPAGAAAETYRKPTVPWMDFLYQPGAAAIEQAGGNWGLIRAYHERRSDLEPLPQNNYRPGIPFFHTPVCKPGAPQRAYTVVAMTSQQAIGGPLVYNSTQQITEPDGLVFLRTSPANPDVTCKDPKNPMTCSYAKGVGRIKPLVLRAAAGDCIEVTLYNAIPAAPSIKGVESQQLVTPRTGKPQVPLVSTTSLQVGLRPQLVIYDPRTSDGTNAGSNPIQTAAPGGGKVVYTWYAGHVEKPYRDEPGRYYPIEFGTANLLPPDPLNHYLHGLYGALIIEPEKATWDNAAGTLAVVKYPDYQYPGKTASFTEFVVFTPDDSNQLVSSGQNYNNVSYGTEPLKVKNTPPRFCDNTCSANDVSCVLATTAPPGANHVFCKQGGKCEECNFAPQTPVFETQVGQQIRFRLLHPGGTNTNEVFELYGHTFLQEPNMTPAAACDPPTTHTNLQASQLLGLANLCGSDPFIPEPNGARPDRYKPRYDQEWEDSLHEWKASLQGHGPSNHFDVLIEQAGGPMHQCGDYLYRTYPADHFNLGMWGILRVKGCPQAPSGGYKTGGK